MGNLWQDIRFGIRALQKSPGFAAVAILTLALGIGANSALFSVVNGVLLNPIPYPDPDRIVTVHESKPNFASGSVSYPNFRDWRKDNQSISSMAIHRANAFILTGIGEAEQINGQFVTSDFFPILGVKPILGRVFLPGEDEIGASPIAILGESLWKRKFGGNQDVLGKSITLDGKDFTIVGVIPAKFDLYLRNTNLKEVFLPIGQWSHPLLNNRGAGLGIHGIARLKPGVTIEQARADMDRVTRNLSAAYPESEKGIGSSLFHFKDRVVGSVRPFLIALLAAVGFVLLIACVNIANLLLARSTGRSREFAIRSALGAGPGRLIRQLLTESTLLALAGGSLGLLFAVWGTKAALAQLPVNLPRAGEVGLDLRVVIFTAAVSLIAGILFGLLPAFKTAMPNLQETLKEGGRGASGVRHRATGVFVVLEMAMALVLLIGAGLMIRSLTALWNVNPGFNPQNVLTFSLSLSPGMAKESPDATRAVLRDFHDNLKATPGIEAVSLMDGAFPMGYDDEQLFLKDGQPKPANLNDMNWALKYIVEPDYLKTMGIPLRRGRFFTEMDKGNAPLTVVVDEVFAKQFFGHEDPVGKLLKVGDKEEKAEIVGVVGHVKQWGLDTDETNELRAQMYMSFMRMPDEAFQGPGAAGVVIRTSGPTNSLLTTIRQAAQKINNENVVFGARTMESIISDTLATRQFSMILLGVFAALALLLASVGIYGVISYLTSQRTHEIGVRVVLGAQRMDVLRLVLGQGAKLALVGVAIGLVAALGLTQFLSTYSMLYAVSPTDPLAIVSAAVLLTVVAIGACYIPARRAMRVDPIHALRHD